MVSANYNYNVHQNQENVKYNLEIRFVNYLYINDKKPLYIYIYGIFGLSFSVEMTKALVYECKLIPISCDIFGDIGNIKNFS